MQRIQTPAVADATGETAEIFAAIKKSVGSVPNAYAAIGALSPAALKITLATDEAIASGTLSAQDIETIKVLVSAVGGCDYCVRAHSLIGKMKGLSPDALRQIRAGEPTGDAKRDALVRFVAQLLKQPGHASDEAFAAIKAAGYTDQQLVEISLTVSGITFTNLFNRINDTTVDFPPLD